MPSRTIKTCDVVHFLEHLKVEFSSMPKGCMKEIDSALKFWRNDLND